MISLRRIGFLLRETVKEWSDDGGAGIAASLAYYTIFSLSPLLIVIALILGLFLDEASIESGVIDSVRSAVGESGAQIIRELIDNRQSAGGDLVGTIIWISVVVWGASGLFAQLQSALNKIWEVKPAPGRSPVAIVKTRLFSFVVVMLIGLILLVTMIVNTGLNSALAAAQNDLLFVGVRAAQFVVTVAMTTVLITLVFKILPDVMIRWHDLWVGAFFTALLFYLGQFVVGLYLARSNVGSVFGAAGSLTAILVWIYYSAQILLFGAEFTEVWARHYGSYIRPDADATWINAAQARREADRANVAFHDTDAEEHKAELMAEQRKRQMARVRRLATVVRRPRRSEEGDAG